MFAINPGEVGYARNPVRVVPIASRLDATVITHLELTDFKAFHGLSQPLRPMTFLLGPNNSGKSSLHAGLRLLAQTETSADSRVPLLLDGPMGDFGTYRDLVFGNHRGRPLRIQLRGRGHGPRQRPRRKGDVGTWKLDLEFKFRTRRRQLILRESELSDADGHIVTATYVPDSDRHVVTRLGGRTVPAQYRAASAEMLRLIHFLPGIYFGVASRQPDDQVFGGLFDREALRELAFRADDAQWSARQMLEDVEYVSAMRLPPERTYHQTGEARARIGAAGENWAGMLVLDTSRTGGATREIRQRLGSWLYQAGLASEVVLNWLSDRHYEVMIRHPVSGELENLADVGQANSQVIPVLVGGLRLRAGATYIVEEPEIHLHPRAQAELGNYFVDLHKAGVALLVETHSEYLVLRIQQFVAAGELDPKRVSFLYVYADPDSGEKVVKELTLDEDARFHEPLDGGFFPQHLDEARKLARLRG